MKLIFPIDRNHPSQSVHASLVGLERLGREKPPFDGMGDPAPRCRPERISVTGTAEPLQTAMLPSLGDHPIAPEAALLVDESFGTSAIAAIIKVRATVAAGQEWSSITI